MDIKRQALKGVKWTTISTIILALTEILKISVLTRFLEKEDFGLMALVIFVMGFMTLFNDMGLTTAILHKQNISKKEYASLYWINWLASFVMFAVLLGITPLTASFYDQPLLNTLIPIIGINLLLTGLGSQYRTIEQKHLLFKFISIVDIIGALLSFVVAILLAVYGFGIYALVYSLLARFTFINLAYFIVGIKKYGLLFHFKFSETKPFLKIGMYQVGGQIVNYFNRDIDILIIGKFFSPSILGGYSLARDLVRKPSIFISSVLNRVAAPALAKYVDDSNVLKKHYLKLTNMLASVTIPMYTIIAIFAYPIVYVVYGESFVEITIIVQILCVNMIFRVIGGNLGNLVVATGRTDLDFKWNIIAIVVTPVFVYIGALYSIEGVAFMVTLSMIALYIPSYHFLVKPLLQDVSIKEYTKAFFLIKNLKNIKL